MRKNIIILLISLLFLFSIIYILKSENKVIDNELNIIIKVSWWCAMMRVDWCTKPLVYNKKNISSEVWNMLINTFDISAFSNVSFPKDACRWCIDGRDRFLTILYKWKEITIDYDKWINYTEINWNELDKKKIIKFLEIFEEEVKEELKKRGLGPNAW